MNKVALVTGAAGGIGRAVSEILLSEQYHLVLLDLNIVHEESESTLALKCDVTKPETIYQAVTKSVEMFGRIDVLFNSAGRSHLGTVEQLSIKEMEAVYDVNVYGTFNAVKAVLPVMKRQGSGHIFNMGSMRGIHCSPGKSAYSMSKFAVRGFSKTLALESRDFGIKVTCINPGFVETDQIWRRIKEEHLQSSDLTQPQDIARTVVWALNLSPGADVEEVTLGRLW